jgi:2-dehydro-3-deoxygalactonokinase
MIGVDWGTSSFRAFRIDDTGRVIDRTEAARGIMTVEDGNFAAVLRAQIGPWLEAGETAVLMSGMIGSRQGWAEAPYLPCPASPDALAGSLVRVIFDGAEVLIVPGLSDRDTAGVPEVMRGEETQLVGAMEAMGGNGLACLPGSHAKWARIEAGRIEGFTTYLGGEAFSAIRAGTILGRMMADAPQDAAAFGHGVARSGEPGHLLHHLFGVRTLGLFGALDETESASYLSGLLIGTEVRAAMPAGAEVWLIGAAALCDLYADAIARCGGTARRLDADAAARGLASIGRAVAWT